MSVALPNSLAEVDSALEKLGTDLQERPEEEVSVARVVESLAPFQTEFLTLLFITPFLQPVPVWGLSTVLGIMLALLHGTRAVQGHGAEIPARVRRFMLSGKRLSLLVRGARFLVLKLRKFESQKVGGAPGRFRVGLPGRWASAVMAVMGILLALPLPVPFSNTVPAFALLFFSMALLTSNGLLLGLAHMALLGNVVFFGLLVVLPFWGVALL